MIIYIIILIIIIGLCFAAALAPVSPHTPPQPLLYSVTPLCRTIIISPFCRHASLKLKLHFAL